SVVASDSAKRQSFALHDTLSVAHGNVFEVLARFQDEDGVAAKFNRLRCGCGSHSREARDGRAEIVKIRLFVRESGGSGKAIYIHRAASAIHKARRVAQSDGYQGEVITLNE